MGSRPPHAGLALPPPSRFDPLCWLVSCTQAPPPCLPYSVHGFLSRPKSPFQISGGFAVVRYSFFWHHVLLLRFLKTRQSGGADRVLLNLAAQGVLIPRARGSIGLPDAEKRFAVGGVLRTLPGLVVGFEEDRLDSVRRRPALDGLVVPLGLLRAGKEGIGPAGSRGWASPFRRFEFQLPPSGLRRHF